MLKYGVIHIKYLSFMKQKRKDILKDLLGEFGSEDYDEIEKESEDNEKPAEVDEPVIPEEKTF